MPAADFSGSSSTVLALHPDRLRARLQEPRLVDYRHRLLIAEVLDYVRLEIISHLASIPVGARQQVLLAQPPPWRETAPLSQAI
jgi:hypothetical protein